MITTNSYSNNNLYLEIYRRTESHEKTQTQLSEMIHDIYQRNDDPVIVFSEKELDIKYLNDLYLMKDIYDSVG